MATGNQVDIVGRIKALLPPWFSDTNPVLNSLLAAFGSALSFIYSLFIYAQLQTRVRTATDGWLDLIAQDFFGTSLRRAANQSDASFRTSIDTNLFRARDTRSAITNVLLRLTGFAPVIIEPFSPADCGAYGVGYCGYGGAGAYGSLSIPAQAFVTAYRPQQAGIAQVAGYGAGPAGYGVGLTEYASLSMIPATVSDAGIYAAIDATKAAGTQMWVRIINSLTPSHLMFDGSVFTFDGEPLTLI